MKNRQRQKGYFISIIIFCSAFAVNLLIQKLFTTQTLVPMIFVFGVFLISLKTHGYCYGITSAIVSVFAVNFAFTIPIMLLTFLWGESILSRHHAHRRCSVQYSDISASTIRRSWWTENEKRECGAICCGQSPMICARHSPPYTGHPPR